MMLRVEEPRRSREGYLVIADIAGYTSFLTGTELEHAQDIIEECTARIQARLAPPLRFIKLEGDAVFCYADSSVFSDGERLIETLEACYFEFQHLLFNMARTTTCRCSACASIATLDLKFVVHFGVYVIQRAHGGEDLAGPDVILVHRLLKNHIVEQTGVEAYAFFTDACLRRLRPSFSLPRHSERYESFGEVGGGVHDLAAVLREMREARREYVDPGEADYESTFVVEYPPALVWQYMVDPVQRLRWVCLMFNRNPDDSQPNARGRAGVGATSHCNHGPAEANREIIDWRPFTYFTTRARVRFRGGFPATAVVVETYEFTPLGDAGTRISWRTRYVQRSRLFVLAMKPIRSILARRARESSARLEAAINEDLLAASDRAEAYARTPGDEADSGHQERRIAPVVHELLPTPGTMDARAQLASIRDGGAGRPLLPRLVGRLINPRRRVKVARDSGGGRREYEDRAHLRHVAEGQHRPREVDHVADHGRFDPAACGCAAPHRHQRTEAEREVARAERPDEHPRPGAVGVIADPSAQRGARRDDHRSTEADAGNGEDLRQGAWMHRCMVSRTCSTRATTRVMYRRVRDSRRIVAGTAATGASRFSVRTIAGACRRRRSRRGGRRRARVPGRRQAQAPASSCEE